MSDESQSYNLEEMNLDELLSLQTEVGKQIKKVQRTEKKALLKQINDLAKKAGYNSAAEMIGGTSDNKRTRSDKGKVLPPKYQSPYGDKTWSGQGRTPNWIFQYESEDGGKSREDLLISE